ncbi:hypothetical protein F5Y11DRAFT_335775 [Daldinia sp. FL1419]|nr:hypothetical protein F5Y11DRAFT_335775 [Daldinia sp. FL1419]
MESELRSLAKRLVEQTERINLLEFADLYIPFVGGFMDLLGRRSVSVEDPVFSGLVRTIIQSFWTRYIVMEQPISALDGEHQSSGQESARSGLAKRVEGIRSQLSAFNQGSLLLVLGRDHYDITGNELSCSEAGQQSDTSPSRAPLG